MTFTQKVFSHREFTCRTSLNWSRLLISNEINILKRMRKNIHTGVCKSIKYKQQKTALIKILLECYLGYSRCCRLGNMARLHPVSHRGEEVLNTTFMFRRKENEGPGGICWVSSAVPGLGPQMSCGGWLKLPSPPRNPYTAGEDDSFSPCWMLMRNLAPGLKLNPWGLGDWGSVQNT